MSDPWAWWPSERIAAVTLCPEPAVSTHWPIIAAALDRRGIYDRDVSLGVIGTIAVETASTFRPIHEYGTPADWAGYDGGAAFAGRGYIQLTHLSNYRAAGAALGIDLVATPDLALDPQIAADILAWYWATKGVRGKDGSRWWSLPDLCRAHDWEWVRRVVQGGTAALGRLITIATALDAIKEAAVVPYDPNAPVDQQPDDWSCSIQAAQWLLRSIGRNPDASDPRGDPWLRSQLVPGIVSPDVGLRNATGQQLADWITREYGAEMGFVAQATPVTFDDVWAGAGVNPMICGGIGYNHWVGIRARNQNGTLAIANPATGYRAVGDSLNRSQWDSLGPWHCVWIDRASFLVPDPPPPPPPDPEALLLAEVKADLRAILAKLDAAGVS